MVLCGTWSETSVAQSQLTQFWQIPRQNAFLFTVNAIFLHDYPLVVEPGSTPRPRVQKKTWRDSLPIDMLLSAVSVLVVAQSSSEIPEGLMNNSVLRIDVHTVLQALPDLWNNYGPAGLGQVYFYASWKRLYIPGCWYVLSPTRKETSYSDQTLMFASHSKKKKNQEVVRPTRSPRQQWPPRRTKNGDLSIVFSVG